MTNEELFGRDYHPLRAMRAIDEADETADVCGDCGESDCDGTCEMCRELSERELRAAMHLNNTLRFIMDGIGVRP